MIRVFYPVRIEDRQEFRNAWRGDEAQLEEDHYTTTCSWEIYGITHHEQCRATWRLCMCQCHDREAAPK